MNRAGLLQAIDGALFQTTLLSLHITLYPFSGAYLAGQEESTSLRSLATKQTMARGEQGAILLMLPQTNDNL